MGATCALNNTIATKEQKTANPPKDPQVSHTSHVRQHLQCLYKVVIPITNAQNDNDNDDSDSTHLSGWDSNDDEEYNHLWPSPFKTPIEGDDMHPPQIHICGQHPGQGWDVNSIGTKNYYHLLITDPSSGRNIVAPYISYAINQLHPTISGTYGKEHPIKTRPLTTASVDYTTPTITVKQQELFYSQAPFASAINHIVEQFCPLDLATAIRQYQYYKDTQYAIQASIKQLQEKEMQYLERAVEILSDLKNANAVGRIMAHEHDINQYALDHLTPSSLVAYYKISQSFKGPIPHSAADTCIHTRERPSIISLPHGASLKFQQRIKEKLSHEELVEQRICECLHSAPGPAKHLRHNIPFPDIPLHVHQRK